MQTVKKLEYHNILDLFNTAESVYLSMRNNGVFASEPDSFRFELQLPHYKAKAFAVVSKGRIKELEIHYETGETETIRSPKF